MHRLPFSLVVVLLVPALLAPLAESQAGEPVTFRLKLDEPLTYAVESHLTVAYDDRPGLRPSYRSQLGITYEPIDSALRDRLPAWRMKIVDDQAPDDATPVLVRITDFSGAFDAPRRLRDTTSHFQLPRDARLSYLVTPRGGINDLRVHPPTDPLIRATIEDIIRTLASTQPALPEHPVTVGDSWTDSVAVEVEDDHVHQTYEVAITYSFEGWTDCGDHQCAEVIAHHDLEANGRYTSRDLVTTASSTGSAEARIVFDVERGKARQTTWSVEVRGALKTVRHDNGATEVTLEEAYDLNATTTLLLQSSTAGAP